MRRPVIIVGLLVILLVGLFPAAAQEPTAAPVYDPSCAIDLMKAYMDGWEYNRRTDGALDMVLAAQVARNVYQAFDSAKIDCQNDLGDFKKNLLRSMHGDYPAEDLTRMLSYIQEAIGNIDYNDCAYSVATQFMRQVDWGDLSAIQVGKTMGEVFRTVHDVIPSGGCDATFQLIQEITSQINDIPADSTLISTLYKIIGDTTEGHYLTTDSCDYTLAKTFFDKVQWDGLTPADIVKVITDTFTITYKISGGNSCDSDPALAITAMLLEDTYRFKPDASVIQQAYDAATGELVPTPEATAPPIVN